MLFRKTLFWTLFLICLTATWNAGFAQSTSATFGGTILDQNGAAIPSVTITMLNRATGLERRTVTNEDGSFTFPLIPPGGYVLTVQRDGFATIKVPDLELNINDQRSVRIQLKVGSISGTINIIPASSLIQDSAAPGATIDHQFISVLPLNSRSADPLITLAPGIVLTGVNEQFGFTSAGQRSDANYFSIDGVNANVGLGFSQFGRTGNPTSLQSKSPGGATNSLVSVDSIREFRIQTSNYAAEFGRTPGAQVQILTRSGTNKFSGSAFEYFRNSALDAGDFFLRSVVANQKKPPLRYNDFGGVIGGPIVRDRTFFFVSYEGLRTLEPAVAAEEVPSLSLRQTVPAQLKPFLDAFPLPTGDPIPTFPAVAPFWGAFSNPSKLNATSLRIDHSLSKNLTIFGRYNVAPSDISRRTISLSLNRIVTNTQTLTAGAVWLVNPKISNELLGNFSRFNVSNYSVSDNFGGAVPLPESVIPAPFSLRNAAFLFDLIPFTRVSEGNLGSGLQRQTNVIDNLSLVANTHQFKFGVDYRHIYRGTTGGGYSQLVRFITSGDLNDPTAPGTLLSGIARFAQVGFSEPVPQSANNLSIYAQDSWKANHHLTLNYGLRWELNPSPTVRLAGGSLADNLLTVLPGFSFGAGQGLSYRTTYTNFAPRVGIALQLSQTSGRELVMRAGVGTFYDLTNNIDGFGYQFGQSKTFENVPFPLSPVDAAPTGFGNDSLVSMVAFDSNLKSPRTYEWNVTLEQSLGRNQVLTAAYIGTAGRQLLSRKQSLNGASASFNPAQPFGLDILVERIANAAFADYSAFQLQFQRRLSRGLEILGSYTLAHSTDTASAGLANDLSHGPSDFDVRHTFTSAISYNLPGPQSKNFPTMMLKDWSVDLISRARSALPVDVNEVRGVATPVQSDTLVIRPNVIPGIPLYLYDHTVPGGRLINPAAFAPIPDLVFDPVLDKFVATQGNLGRNALRGFPAWQIDFGIRRQFSINDRMRLQFRVEAFNIFNHPNFANPAGSLDSRSFGQFGISSSSLGSGLGSGGPATGGQPSGLNTLAQFGGPRSIQFGLRFQF